MNNNLIINLPQNLNILLWIKNDEILNIWLYNKEKNYKLALNLNYCKSYNDIKINKNVNTITFSNNLLNYENNKIINFFNNFFKSWDTYFFEKIKFKGKGFRMRFFKKNKFVKFFFGKSHKTFLFFKNIKMKRINKYKFILRSINKNKLNVNKKYAVNIRPVNKYTLRGIRSSKQIIYKRKGKKGTYI